MMISKKMRKSSRKAMDARNKTYTKSPPGSYMGEVQRAGKIIVDELANRSMRKHHAAIIRGKDGREAKENAVNYRKSLLKKARRVIAKMQKESRKLMRQVGKR